MRVVIVDDSPSSLQVLSAMVAAIPDCTVVTFTDSAKGLQWCLDHEPDLVLVDFNMPPPDGLQLIELIRRDPRRLDVPVVMVSSCEEREIRHRALRLGATDFLSKPVDESEFIARVRNLLKLHQSHRALSNRAAWLASEVGKATRALVEREREAILILSRAAEFRDPETAQHLVRMATYCRLIAEALGLPYEEIELIFTAAPMHDIGKIGIPDHILLKPGKLTPDEEELMRRHAGFGADILSGSTSPLIKKAAEIAQCHHEKFDGTGYPDGLAAINIPLAGRIAALADVFDALTSERPYKKAWPLDRALDYIQANRGFHFDPACVDAFMRQWPLVLTTLSIHRSESPLQNHADEMIALVRNALFPETDISQRHF